MPSPFPGMDPWLEDPDLFPDLHARLTLGISDALNITMPQGYVATTRTRVWIDDEQWLEPDARTFESRERSSRGGTATATPPAGLQPLGVKRPCVKFVGTPREQIYLEIRSLKGRRLVTAVEVLSPSNKESGSKGREDYAEKREECSLGGVNFVELDFLRSGVHSTIVPRSRLARLAGGAFHYHVCVAIAGGEEQPLLGAVFPLDRPLPEIEIPLDLGVPMVVVDLQAILNRAYDFGRYADLVDYTQPPTSPLSPEEQAWADGILRARTPGGR